MLVACGLNLDETLITFGCRGLSTGLVSVERSDEEDFTDAQDPSHVVATATKGTSSINGLNLDETAQPRSL